MANQYEQYQYVEGFQNLPGLKEHIRQLKQILPLVSFEAIKNALLSSHGNLDYAVSMLCGSPLLGNAQLPTETENASGNVGMKEREIVDTSRPRTNGGQFGQDISQADGDSRIDRDLSMVAME